MKKAAIALAFISFFVTGWSQNVGIGTITPAASAQLEVSSINKGFLTPRMTSIQMFQIASPDEGLIVYNTTLKKLFYFNGTEWRNLDGTILMDVGNYYQGGKIAYVLKLGDPGFIEGEIHGLISAASDQSAQAEWGCYGTTIPGADGTALGTGNQNTIDIIAGCVTAGIAANICSDLVLNGYSDWYLPSKEELNKLYGNQLAIGGFESQAGSYYYSSSESSSNHAWAQTFLGGFQGQYTAKNTTRRVRAVRAF